MDKGAFVACPETEYKQARPLLLMPQHQGRVPGAAHAWHASTSGQGHLQADTEESQAPPHIWSCPWSSGRICSTLGSASGCYCEMETFWRDGEQSQVFSCLHQSHVGEDCPSRGWLPRDDEPLAHSAPAPRIPGSQVLAAGSSCSSSGFWMTLESAGNHWARFLRQRQRQDGRSVTGV